MGGSAQCRWGLVGAMLSAMLVAHFGPASAHAANSDCGQPFSNGVKPVTTDALFVLRAGLGLETCDFCICDLNDNGVVSSTDALIDLGVAVGQPIELNCPACSTTTTTLGDCPPEDGLDDVVFNEVYTCVEAFPPDPYFCVDSNEPDAIHFSHTDNGNYQVLDEPDTGFVYTGTLECDVFTWSATSPNGYTENGTWTFSSDLTSFSGSSNYVADNGSYNGQCNTTGAEAPATPPNPQAIPPCQ